MEDDEQQELCIEDRFNADVKYINKEILAKQKDGAYCTWSAPLKTVAIIGLTETQYYDYWGKQYKKYPEYSKEIMRVCRDKLHNGLISAEQMIDMIAKSSDFVSEKEKAIKALGGKFIQE